MNSQLPVGILEENSSNKPFKLSATGKILIGLTGGVALGLTAICVPFVSPALRSYCLPYVPATDVQVRNVFQALRNQGGGRLVDLGSGDGRIVLEGTRRNFVSHGVELNPWLVLYSRLDALRKGFGGKAQFFRKNLWKFDVSGYDHLVIFGVQSMMVDLERKLISECKSNCNIVACRFPLPTLVLKATVGSGVDTVWLYGLPPTKTEGSHRKR